MTYCNLRPSIGRVTSYESLRNGSPTLQTRRLVDLLQILQSRALLLEEALRSSPIVAAVRRAREGRYHPQGALNDWSEPEQLQDVDWMMCTSGSTRMESKAVSPRQFVLSLEIKRKFGRKNNPGWQHRDSKNST